MKIGPNNEVGVYFKLVKYQDSNYFCEHFDIFELNLLNLVHIMKSLLFIINDYEGRLQRLTQFNLKEKVIL